MNKFSFLLLTLLFTNLITAQNDCTQSKSITKFKANNVNYPIIPNGSIVDFNNGNYQVVANGCEPTMNTENSCPFTIYASGIWAGGKTQNGNFKLAATSYHQLGNDFDWYAGPLDTSGEPFECADWDKVFQVNKSELEALKTNYVDGIFTGIDCNQLTDNIKYWPSKGNPYWNEKYNFELPNQELATFYDFDHNGIYDPCNGDLPNINFLDNIEELNPEKIINMFPNQVSFWIINDNGGPHKLSAGNNLKMELHFYAYGFTGEEDLDNTSFVKMRSFYKGNETLEDFYFGIWTDPDIGCYADDYIGIDTLNHMTYAYNTDAIDGSNGNACGGSLLTFTNIIPILGIQLLEGVKNLSDEDTGLKSALVFNNESIGNPDPPTTTAENIDLQFYNNLRGLWRTGEAMKNGGSGYNPGSTDTVKYLFTDPPNDSNGWSMCSANLPLGDRIVLMNTGGISLEPGAINEITFAYIYQPTSILPCPDITELQNIAKVIKEFHDNNYIITSIDENIIDRNNLTYTTLINSFSLKDINEKLEVSIVNLNGSPVEKISINDTQYSWISPTHLSNGLYIVNIESESKYIVSFKQIVMR